MQRLGERFWQPPGQEKNGIWLGLSIVRDVAQLHGIQLSFSQRVGRRTLRRPALVGVRSRPGCPAR
nr:Sensor protein QseC [Candidatus Pantoea persica]